MSTELRHLDQNYSLDNYKKLIDLLLHNDYSTCPFTVDSVDGKAVFLRHDIDYSMFWAEQFADVNEKMGVHGTFFLQLRSPLYNPFSYESRRVIKRILDAGQYIAFHFALNEGCNTYEAVYELLREDYRVFKECVPEVQPVFAWHNPNVMFSAHDDLVEREFPGFVNVYGEFAGGGHPYYADSNMRYTVRELEEFINKGEPSFQLALAPMQWCPDADNMLSVMAANMVRKVVDNELEFLDNHIYKACFPAGLSQQQLEGLSECIERKGSEV